MCAPASPVTSPAADALHARFLILLPRIERHVRCYFRDVRCEHRKQEYLAEAVALSWKWFTELARRGKDAAGFVAVLARYAALAVCSGRKVTGQEPARDVLSPTAQRKHGFRVGGLPTSARVALEHLYATPRGQQRQDTLEECLHDNTVTPVPDQVCFRLDFPAWRSTHTERDRRVIDALMVGSRAQEVAGQFRLTKSRVSQLRRAFFEDWAHFCGGGVEDEQAPAAMERGSACPA